MTSDAERIAKLEIQVDHLNSTIDKMAAKIDRMHDLMNQTKGGWFVLVAIAGASSFVTGIAMKFIPYLLQFPR